MASVSSSEQSEVARSLDLSIIRYSRVWEDHRVLSEALQINENDDVISITRYVCTCEVPGLCNFMQYFLLALVIMSFAYSLISLRVSVSICNYAYAMANPLGQIARKEFLKFSKYIMIQKRHCGIWWLINSDDMIPVVFLH